MVEINLEANDAVQRGFLPATGSVRLQMGEFCRPSHDTERGTLNSC